MSAIAHAIADMLLYRRPDLIMPTSSKEPKDRGEDEADKAEHAYAKEPASALEEDCQSSRNR